MQKEGIILKKGGKLFETKWVYDDEADKGEFVTTEITKDAPKYLFEVVELDHDIVLRDIFFLINKHLDIFEIILGNWVKDFTEEALSSIGKPYTGNYNHDEIEYLELSTDFREDNWGSTDKHSYGNLFPDFGGIGFLLKEKHEYREAGTRINWGVSFSPVGDLINIPLKLKKDAQVYKVDYTVDLTNRKELKDYTKEFGPLHNISYSLGHILYGIVWELSWNGPPESRDKLKKELKGIVDEIKNGSAKLKLVDIDED